MFFLQIAPQQFFTSMKKVSIGGSLTDSTNVEIGLWVKSDSGPGSGKPYAAALHCNLISKQARIQNKTANINTDSYLPAL